MVEPLQKMNVEFLVDLEFLQMTVIVMEISLIVMVIAVEQLLKMNVVFVEVKV